MSLPLTCCFQAFCRQAQREPGTNVLNTSMSLGMDQEAAVMCILISSIRFVEEGLMFPV